MYLHTSYKSTNLMPPWFFFPSGDQWLIRKFCRPDLSVYVPFAGTGTAAIAAVLEGRSCLCVDKDIRSCKGRLQKFKVDVDTMLVKSDLALAEQQGGLTSATDLYQKALEAVPVATQKFLAEPTRALSVAAVQHGFTDGWDLIKWWLKSMPAAELKSTLSLIQQSENAENLLSLQADIFDWVAVLRHKLAFEEQQGPFAVAGTSAAVAPAAAAAVPSVVEQKSRGDSASAEGHHQGEEDEQEGEDKDEDNDEDKKQGDKQEQENYEDDRQGHEVDMEKDDEEDFADAQNVSGSL